MILNKHNTEKMCRGAGLHPTKRERFQDREIYVADGFSERPEFTFKRFGVDPGEFPNGAFCTIWFVAKSESFFELGHPLLFDKFHDPVISPGSKQMARVNKAVQEAQESISRRAQLNG